MFLLQVLLLNLLNDQLVVFCADNQIDIFNLTLDQSASCESIPSGFFFHVRVFDHSAFPFADTSVNFTKVRTFDANRIPGLSFHPACVILVALTNLRTETSRNSGFLGGGGGRDSLSRESPTGGGGSPAKQLQQQQQQISEPSIILNVCGRVIMIQSEPKNEGRESPQMVRRSIAIFV